MQCPNVPWLASERQDLVCWRPRPWGLGIAQTDICKLNCMLSCSMHSGMLYRACGVLFCLTICVDRVTCKSTVSHSSAAVRAFPEVRDLKTLSSWFQHPQGDTIILA